MSKKPIETIYKKILKDISRYDSGSSSNMVNYKDSNGIETETTFRVPPSPDELEGLLLWLNKEQLPQA